MPTGYPETVTCKECGDGMPADFAYCSSCGAKLPMPKPRKPKNTIGGS